MDVASWSPGSRERVRDGARDVVATFGIALAFWQPSLTCSLDNPLEFLAEGWIVGNS